LSRNSGASTSRNPKGPSRPAAGKLYLYLYNKLKTINTTKFLLPLNGQNIKDNK
jgi:hypothetical protein